MPIYTDPFGGSTIQPSQVAYRAVALAASVVLAWPWDAIDANVAARFMDVTPAGAGLTITMPSATEVSAGQDAVFTNLGASSYTVLKNDGSTLCVVAPGTVQYTIISSNATAAGVWRVFQFASLASAVTAAALVGPGIAANGAALYNSLVTTPVSVSTSVLAADRTKAFKWTGGIGTLTMPPAGGTGNDFFVDVANRGTGLLTIAMSGGDTIDGAVNLQLNLTESCRIYSDGIASFHTVGRGRSTQFSFTLLSKAVSTGTVTLTVAEAQNVVQKYTGALTGNVSVVLPSTVQVYYVNNLTTNAFTLTFKTAGVGTTVAVPTNQTAILFCDGLNVVNTVTATAAVLLNVLTAGTYLTGGTFDGSSPKTFAVDASTTGAASKVVAADGSGNVGLGVAPAVRLHIKSANDMLRLETTTTRGTGGDILTMYDPTGLKAQFGYPAASDDLYISNELTANLILRTAGAARITVDSIGRVGIGKTPATTLDVQGIGQFWSGAAGTFNHLNVGRTSSEARIAVAANANDFLSNTAAGDALFYSVGAGAAWYGVAAAGPAIFVTNNAERMRIDASGNVLVGTTAALAKLTVGGLFSVLDAAQAGYQTQVLSAAGLSTISAYFSTGQALAFATTPNGGSSTERMRIDTSGNVGIGAAPQAKFDVAGSVASNAQAIFARGVSDPNFQLLARVGAVGSAVGTSMFTFGQEYNGGGMYVGLNFLRGSAATDGALAVFAGNAERMRIDASGNVGFGLSSGLLARVHTSADNPANGYLGIFSNSHNAAGRTGSFIVVDATSIGTWKTGIPADVSAWTVYDVGATAERMRIDGSGHVGFGAAPGTYHGRFTFDGSTVNGLIVEDTVAGGVPTLFNVVKNGSSLFNINNLGAVAGQSFSGTSLKATTGLNITGNGGFLNAANKFGIDVNGAVSRLYASGPSAGVKGSYEIHIISSDGSADSIALIISNAGAATFLNTVTATTFSGALSGNATTSSSTTGNAATATTLATARNINGVAFDGSAAISVNLNNVLTAGTYLTSGGTFDGSAARTFAVDATSANTASKVVARDGSGNFLAGTITADLTGAAALTLSSTGATAINFNPNGANKFVMTSDGRFYGTALHNNAGAMTGTTNQYVGSGTYTPTLTNVTNIAASTATVCRWLRVGNIVTVVGTVQIDPTTASAFSQLRMSLPIASTMPAGTELGGTAARNSSATVIVGALFTDAVNNKAELVFVPDADVANRAWSFNYSYEVL